MDTMDPRREEMDAEFGAFDNEFQAALSLSQAEAPADDREEIARLVKAGRFVVVVSYPRYCPLTDALMGESLSLVSDHGTLAEAYAACPESNEDVWYEVRRPAPGVLDAQADEGYAQAAALRSIGDEIPF